MILLSYQISATTPMYNNSGFPEIKHMKTMSCGDSCNQTAISLSQHTGTHVDAPFHFSEKGATITGFAPEFWTSEKVFLCTMSKTPEEKSVIDVQSIEDQLNSASAQTEVLILKTNYCQVRGTDKYWRDAPGFSPELAPYFRRKFPKLRFFGFDLISLTSLSHRDLGRTAHKMFLEHEHPILIIEDMDLTKVSAQDSIKNILISPLFVKDADGAPCTIWANMTHA